MRRAFACLLLLLSLSFAVSAHADARMEHGRWTSQFLDGMGEATTHENGTSTFGILCAAGSCRYYFANGIDCQPGGNYPFMITTDVGALTIEGVCEPVATANGDILVYWFNESEPMNRAFQGTPVVGFAFPLTDGTFRISTFSMEGYAEAVERMVNGVRQQRELPASTQQQDLQLEIQEVAPEAPKESA